MTILVIGASGNVGRNVVDQLLAAGERVRAASRNPETAGLPDGVEPVAMDLMDPATLPTALRGVRKVFLYTKPEGVDAFVRAAKEAGVEHAVLLSSSSVLAADADTNPIAIHHAVMENAIAGSGIPWTFVRPGGFATNSLWWAPSIREEGVVRVPYPEAQIAPIHEADMAEVAVRALTESGHEGQGYLLTGPESVTQRSQVESIADATGRSIRLEELAPEQAEGLLPEPLLRYFAASEGKPAEVSPVFEQVTGHQGRTFAQWAADHAADFR